MKKKIKAKDKMPAMGASYQGLFKTIRPTIQLYSRLFLMLWSLGTWQVLLGDYHQCKETDLKLHIYAPLMPRGARLQILRISMHHKMCYRIKWCRHSTQQSSAISRTWWANNNAIGKRGCCDPSYHHTLSCLGWSSSQSTSGCRNSKCSMTRKTLTNASSTS